MRITLLALAASVLLGACASPSSPPAQRSDGGGDAPRHYDADESSTMGAIGNAVLSVPETAIVWPYKIVSGGLRGIYDGVASGVEDAPLPVIGVVASPLTGGFGLLKGLGKGVAMEPYYVGNSSEFVQALGKPWESEH